MKDYLDGLKKGIPICLGYISVSFTFGIMVVNSGLPVWMALFISMTNLTSSGQFAGTKLILAGASYFEITFATFIINIRYMLMSLSLSQKIDKNTKMRDKLIYSFGITDEVFAVASTESKPVTASYMYGLITTPYIGWSLGTLLGAVASNLLPASLAGAMGIALYAMFIAIIIPASKKSKNILFIMIISVFTTCVLKYAPILCNISSGFRIIISTLVGAGVGALLFPEQDTNINDISDNNSYYDIDEHKNGGEVNVANQ